MTDFINGFTIGVEKPMIIISSGSVGLLSYDELLFKKPDLRSRVLNKLRKFKSNKAESKNN